MKEGSNEIEQAFRPQAPIEGRLVKSVGIEQQTEKGQQLDGCQAQGKSPGREQLFPG